jgi:hypothetical protein
LKKKSVVLRKNNQIKIRNSGFKKINLEDLKNKFGQNKKGSYFCTPKSKMGGKKGQKIFESLEVTAQSRTVIVGTTR